MCYLMKLEQTYKYRENNLIFDWLLIGTKSGVSEYVSYYTQR